LHRAVLNCRRVRTEPASACTAASCGWPNLDWAAALPAARRSRMIFFRRSIPNWAKAHAVLADAVGAQTAALGDMSMERDQGNLRQGAWNWAGLIGSRRSPGDAYARAAANSISMTPVAGHAEIGGALSITAAGVKAGSLGRPPNISRQRTKLTSVERMVRHPQRRPTYPSLLCAA
jgi:hypothetical protein